MACISHMGRKVSYNSPAASPEQADAKVPSADEVDDAMRYWIKQTKQAPKPVPIAPK